MDDRALCEASCKKCGHTWLPYGSTFQNLPHIDNVKCPECGNEQEIKWLDSETKRKLLQEKLGLNKNNATETRIANLEAEVKILKDMISVQDTKRELVENNVSNIIAWAKKREQDFDAIEEIAKELEEDYDRFKQENK